MDQDNNVAAAVEAGQLIGSPHQLDDGRVAFVLPEHHGGSKLEIVDPEEYAESLAERPRRKIGVRELATAESFVRYVNAHKTEATAVYADKDRMHFRAVLNDHTPEAHGGPAIEPIMLDAYVERPTEPVKDGEGVDENADPAPERMELPPGVIESIRRSLLEHAPKKRLAGRGDFGADYACPVSVEWKRWHGKSQHNVDNKQGMRHDLFVQFIEDNLADITTPDAGALLAAVRSFEAKKDVKFASAVRLDSGDLSFKFVEETNQVVTEGKLALPELFTITIPVFDGGRKYEIDAKIRHRISNGGLTLWYELVRPHKIVEHAFAAAMAEIQQGLGDTPIYSV